jgi:hypothetical protein
VPAPRARQIILTAAERHRLEKLAYSRTVGYQQVIRARIVLDTPPGSTRWRSSSPSCSAKSSHPTDLEDLLARIERHEQKELNQQHEHDHQPAALAAA